jgi:ATP-dependent protease Clp ATPase subunit
VFFPSKIKLDKNQNIVIDTEKIFFIEKLALNGLDTIWVD